MANLDIKIYISAHKACWFPQNDFMFPIQVGAANAKDHIAGILHDDDGDNISDKNPMYCELTGQYWVWKHVKADYYGFFHYRRYMSFSEKHFETNPFQDVLMTRLNDAALDELCLDRQRVEHVVKNYDIIATSAVNLDDMSRQLKSNYHQYEYMPYQYHEDIDVMLEIIKEKYPEFYKDAVKYMASNKGYYCNMFIMKDGLFQTYSSWLFDILLEHEKRRDYTNYSKMGYRVSGYLGERLFGIFYYHMQKSGKYRCTELQRTLFQHVDIPEQVNPYFTKNNVAVALAANDCFAPYTSTMILSMMEHASKDQNYDILILSSDMSADNQKKLLSLIADHDNFAIRFLDPSELIGEYHFFTKDHFSKETYYRLVLPELLPDYDKILYLDSDMIAQADVAELFWEDVSGYLLAATRDPDSAGLYNGYIPGKKDYIDKILKIKHPFDYFQAGTILFNLAEFRRTYKTEEILKYATAKHWQLLDQDILNHLCEGKVKFLNLEWNVVTDLEGKRISEIIALAPHWLEDEYLAARKQPKIIHYAGPEKPWMHPEMDMADIFWHYARKTPYYETMLYRMAKGAANELMHPVVEKKTMREKILPYGSKRRELAKNIYYHFVK